jgi:signal transduction histidine kinase
MGSTRSVFSRRHLVALALFLVPLGALALLGWRELQRTGNVAQAALASEGQQFLASARQTVEQRIDGTLARLRVESQRLLLEKGPNRTAVELRQQPEFAALRSIVLLDEQIAIEWPRTAVDSANLAFADDGRSDGDSIVAQQMQSADLLLTHGDHAAAITLLQQLATTLEKANPPGNRRSDLLVGEIKARFRLATAHRKVGERAAAVAQFQQVRTLINPDRNFIDSERPMFLLMTEVSLAELGTAEDRLRVLQAVAENKYDTLDDGMLSAVAQRLAAHFPADDPERPRVETLLREDRQRATARAFAVTYDLALKYGLALRRLRQPANEGADDRLIATTAGDTLLVAVRKASNEEASGLRCAWIGLHLDLGELLRPALQQFRSGERTFALAVTDPDAEDAPLLAPPAMPPPGFDPAAFVADADARTRTRTLMMLAMLLAAVGGALWSWRSVSREAELAQLKVELVSRVSHELKTPLALIRMYGETLGMGRARDSGQAAEFGTIIARESERLTALIQRILDFSRQQAGTLTYSPRTLDLGELLRSIAESYAPHLEARGVLLIDSLPFGIEVSCDRSACESAIVNLLENAAKYGPADGEHEIELELRKGDGGAVIEVRDHGRGIPADEHERVFDGFYRASNAGEVRGAGLGLSLVRHFARAHGGDANASPRPGGGTTIRLWLPLAAATIPLATPAPTTS